MTVKPKVLLVEDDGVLRRCIAEELVEAGFAVLALAEGTGAEALAGDFRPDAAVLDIMLPGESGLAIAERLRRSCDAAVLFLTARDSISDRLAGFAAGADDYLVKPFEMAELLARIRAVLRRTGGFSSTAMRVGDLLVDEDTGQVSRGGVAVPLTATEMKVLVYLTRNRGRVLSKTQILTQVWGYEAYDPNLVEAFVSALRRKLESNGPRLIHTVRGVGYRLSEPVAVGLLS